MPTAPKHIRPNAARDTDGVALREHGQRRLRKATTLTIAGAIAIPNDLREMSADFGLPRRQRWRQLILPAIFPAYVTGGITAAGGAWNASIVAEVVAWGSHHLSATGLGAYITEASDSAAPDHFAKVLTGVIVMSLYVVLVNRLFWQRLYRLADSHFTL